MRFALAASIHYSRSKLAVSLILYRRATLAYYKAEYIFAKLSKHSILFFDANTGVE